MHDAVDRVVSPFLADADAALGTGYSAVLYGSAARSDFIPGRSDVNLMLILDDLSLTALRALGSALRGWRKSTHETPLLTSRAEWGRATDVFPVEITDMRTGYQVLRGPDPLAGVVVDPAHLRPALERELRGKLLRLRQGYAALAADPAALGALAVNSVSTILVLLRGLLSLLGRPIPADSLDLAAAAAAAAGAEPEHLLQVVRHRGERNWRCDAREFEQYMDAVAHTARWVDQLQLGDQR